MVLVSSISLLHSSLAVAGLAGGLIPLIIHLINRRRHRRVDWAAMAFLLSAARRRSRRMRLEHWLLFAVRVLAIVLFGLALARPYVRASRFLPVGKTQFHRIILLDNSGSMGAWIGEADRNAARAHARGSAFDHACEIVSDLIDSFPESDAVSLVSLADPATTAIKYPSFDRREIREALAELPLTERGTDLAGGFDRVLELLDKSSTAPNNRCVYVVSDLAGDAWSGGSDGAGAGGGKPRGLKPAVRLAARRVAEQAELVVVPVGAPGAAAPVANAGVSRLALESTLTSVRIPVRFGAEVVNYGVTEVRDAVLRIGVLTGGANSAGVVSGSHPTGRIERRITLPTLEPGQAETVTFSLVFDSSGSHVVQAHLDFGSYQPAAKPVPQDQPALNRDRLDLDNDRWLSVEVTEHLDVLVVDGAPGRTRLAGQAGYLLTALNPQPEGQRAGIVSPKAISDLELGGEILPEYQVVILCNVERLDEDIWRRLLAYVENGGGLLVFAGEAVNIDHYNRLGDGILPGELKPAVGGFGRAGSVRADASPTAHRENAKDETALGFVVGDPVHPLMADFASAVNSGLFTASVERRIPLDIDESAAEIVLRYTNQEPAVAIRRRGSGLCGFVTTSADMAWNNLPAKGDYVSLMMNLVAYLAQPQAVSRNVEVGRPIVRSLTAGESSMALRVHVPGGGTAEAVLAVADGGFVLRWDDTERVGVYTTFAGNMVQRFAVNPPPAESDLKPIDRTTLAEDIAAPFTYVTDVEELVARTDTPATGELGFGIVCVVLALLICETWLAMGQGRLRNETHQHPSHKRTSHNSALTTQHSALRTQDSLP